MHIIVDIHISREEYLRWYQGSANAVVAQARDGRTIRFPADALQSFVTHNGIAGSFAIYFDSNNKLQKVERLR